MSHITLEPSVVSQLLASCEPVELRDAAGNRVGHFVPLKSRADAELLALAEKMFDPKELDRRLREESGQGIPYSEVKKRLQALENNE